jgi:hypothetical protein
MGWLWLLGAVVLGGAAYAAGSRESRDLNTERYLAWRGRADRTGASSSEGMTGEERRRLWIAAALGAAALFALVAFFTYA